MFRFDSEPDKALLERFSSDKDSKEEKSGSSPTKELYDKSIISRPSLIDVK